jgi:hypothetical protein
MKIYGLRSEARIFGTISAVDDLHSNLEFLEDAGMGIDYGFPVVYSP